VNPELVVQLRDIRGLDAVPWWPPGPGWWLLGGLCIGLVAALVYLVRHLRRYPAGSWHRSAWKELRQLKRDAERMPPDQLAAALSELLRRIAIARVGRAQAAALTGERWLAWLQEHDPAGFEWTQRGRPLLTLPYAPPEMRPQGRDQLLALLDAAFPWTDKHGWSRHV
jgi:hypothetical protein